jgi:branched-chain amino acid aminotransferase
MHFDTESWKIAPELKKRLSAIREGSAEDTHSWLFKV